MPCTRDQFEAAFPPIIEDLVKHGREYNMPDNALQWFETVRFLSLSLKFLLLLPGTMQHLFPDTKSSLSSYSLA